MIFKVKKILFLINTLNGGGAEKILVDTVNNIDKTKYDVTLQTVTNRGVMRKNLNSDVHYKSIVSFQKGFLQRIFSYLISFVIPPSITHSIFIGNKYDIEIAFLEGVPTKIIGSSKNCNSKKLAWVHIDLYNTFGLEKVYKNLKEHIECYKRFDKIVCVSESAKNAFTKRFGIDKNLVVRYNVLDDSKVREKAKETVDKTTKFRIVSVGRLTNQKSFDRLLVAFKKIIDLGEDCELIIVGEGIERENLQKYIDNNSLNGRVELVGFSDNPYKYMQSADLLVYPSRAEGYSTVVTESVILGKPILVTDCAGMREILGDSECGLVVENNDEALFIGLKELVQNDELRENYAKKAGERAKDFTVAARINELEELFK